MRGSNKLYLGNTRTGLYERGNPSPKRPSQDRGMGATTEMGNRARTFSGKKGKWERKRLCLGNVTQWLAEESPGQTVPKSSSLGSFIHPSIWLPCGLRMMGEAYGVCKIGRLQMASKKIYIYFYYLKQLNVWEFQFDSSGLWANAPSLLWRSKQHSSSPRGAPHYSGQDKMRKKEQQWLPEAILTSLNLLTFCLSHKAADPNFFGSYEKLMKARDSLPRKNIHICPI